MQIIYCQLSQLHINDIINLVFVSTKLEMLNSITQSFFLCEIYILANQVKHIFKRPDTRAEILGDIIHTNLVRPVRLIRYNKSKYGLLLTDYPIRLTKKILLKKKVK